tara:strand:- start:110001 stop:110813 length:813 start_codon:yes stop_codon:yes gene_type:complete
MTKKSLFFSIALTCFFFVTSAVLNKQISKPPIKIEKQMSAINFQDSFYRLLFAGYKRMVADLLWIATLLESDLSHYKKKDLNNWMFLRFKSITDLDPKFLHAYSFGGQYLNIIKDDVEGAAYLFDKGLSYYPNNYSLNFNGGYLYAFELAEYDRAVKLYERIRHHPSAPKFIDSLIAKLKYEETGDLKTTFNVLKEMLKNESRDTLLIEKLKKDLYSIKATIDLECLNTINDSSCSRLDYKGQPYVLRDDEFTTQEPFSPYKLYTKKKGD